jgi:hypothetical protein
MESNKNSNTFVGGNYLGLVTLKSFGQDPGPVCVHTQNAPKFSKGKTNEYEVPAVDLTSLISGCDTFTSQNMPENRQSAMNEHSIE